MMIHITPKKINSKDKLPVSVTFSHQGVKYEERYKSKGYAINAIKRSKDMFVSLVDIDRMKVVRRDDLASYIASK